MPTETRPDADRAPLGGWVLLAGSDGTGIDVQLERFGQVYRCPVAPGTRATELAPGQPCFLVRTDRSKVIGLWAIGEVVGLTLTLPSGAPALPAEAAIGLPTDDDGARTYAEVELLPLSKPISVDKLLADDVLGTSELARWSDPNVRTPGEPLRLSPAEVQAIESIEFWIDAPTDDQRTHLDELLADEDDALDRLD